MFDVVVAAGVRCGKLSSPRRSCDLLGETIRVVTLPLDARQATAFLGPQTDDDLAEKTSPSVYSQITPNTRSLVKAQYSSLLASCCSGIWRSGLCTETDLALKASSVSNQAQDTE